MALKANCSHWEKINFDVYDIMGDIQATRNQFPIKLGYVTTVDKTQGRTIVSLIVDCYKLLKTRSNGCGCGQINT